jgi:hypothetical protein
VSTTVSASSIEDQHGGRLAGERGLDHVPLVGVRDLLAQLDIDRVRQLAAGGHQQAGGQHVVLGLGDEVGRDVGGVGGVVGEDRDLGRAGLRVDADDAAQRPLSGGHVNVARPGDHVHRRAAWGAVGEHGDRLGAPGAVDLVHPEQGARGEHDGVHLAAELPLRRGGHGDRAHAGDLRRHHVHDHRAGIDVAATRDVEPDPIDGHVPLGDGPAGHHLGGVAGAQLRRVDQPGVGDRGLQGVTDRRVQSDEGRGDQLDRHPQLLERDAVEARGRREHAGVAPVAHVLEDRRDVRRRAGRQAGRRSGRGGEAPAQATGDPLAEPAATTVGRWLVASA